MVMQRAHLRKCFRETGIISLLRAIEVKAGEGSPCRMRITVCGGVINAVIAGAGHAAAWAVVR